MSLGIFRAFKNSISAGGNFGYIAQNIAAIYTALGYNDFGKYLDEDKKLYATGIIDAYSYICEGVLSYEEISDCIAFGDLGFVRLGFYTQQHRKMFDTEQNERIIGLAMQLEAYIFASTFNGKIDYHDIVDMVVREKPTISRMINSTLNQGIKCPIYKEVLFTVETICKDNAFRDLVNSYSNRY